MGLRLGLGTGAGLAHLLVDPRDLDLKYCSRWARGSLSPWLDPSWLYLSERRWYLGRRSVLV